MSAIGDWVEGFVIRKGVVSLVKLVISWLFAGGVVKVLESYGVKVDEATLTLELTAGINTLLAMLKNWLIKTNPKVFGWL